MRAIQILFPAVLGCCLPVALADTVEMKPEGDDPAKEGLKLEGKISRETPEFIVLSVNEDKGSVRISRAKIKNIEYDIKNQEAKLKDDDFAGQYKIGVWAMEKGMYADAIDVFEKLIGKQGPGPDMLKQLAKCYDERKLSDKALKNYSDYLLLHPDDAQVAERVKVLNAEVNPNGDKPKEGDAPVVKKNVDGLEADGVWAAENWGNPGKIQFTTDASGNKMVAAQSDGGTKDKVAFSRTGQPLNLSESKEILFKVFHNCPTPLHVAVAFMNSQGELHELPQIQIASNGWVSKSLKIDGKSFKAARTEWKEYNLELEGKERISRILFMVYGQRPFTLYIDSLFFK